MAQTSLTRTERGCGAFNERCTGWSQQRQHAQEASITRGNCHWNTRVTRGSWYSVQHVSFFFIFPRLLTRSSSLAQVPEGRNQPIWAQAWERLVVLASLMILQSASSYILQRYSTVLQNNFEVTLFITMVLLLVPCKFCIWPTHRTVSSLVTNLSSILSWFFFFHFSASFHVFSFGSSV